MKIIIDKMRTEIDLIPENSLVNQILNGYWEIEKNDLMVTRIKCNNETKKMIIA